MTEHNQISPQAECLFLPQWVKDMHEYYRDNGFYRAEDIQRVLGDPRECVSVTATSDLSQLARNQ